jgi:hypothetical protein
VLRCASAVFAFALLPIVFAPLSLQRSLSI